MVKREIVEELEDAEVKGTQIQIGIGTCSESAREDITYQDPFKESIKCRWCKKPGALLMMLVDDGQKLVASERPKVVAIWPHDSMVIALYFCHECGEITALWNQA